MKSPVEAVKAKRRERERDLGSKDRHSRKVWALLLIAAFLFLAFVLESYRCSSDFIVTEYRIDTEKVTSTVRIVLIGDLHESEFGDGNERLIEAVRELGPDLILCSGDMITRNSPVERMHIGLDLMAAMVSIAPTYMSLGNHETIYAQNYGPWLIERLITSGVNVLDRTYTDVSVNGQTVRIGGISEYCFKYGQTQEEYEASAKYAFLNDLSASDDYTILLCHRPVDYYLKSMKRSFEDWDIELVLSGHTHGGLVRLPFIDRSPYLPQQGFMPELDYGRKDMGSAEMIITSGLGNEQGLFRINDPCEVVVISLEPMA